MIKHQTCSAVVVVRMIKHQTCSAVVVRMIKHQTCSAVVVVRMIKHQAHRAGGGEARSAFAPGIWKEWQRPLMICSAVWASPEPHGHHRYSDSQKRPTRVLNWFSLHHAERLSPRSRFPTLGGGREWGGVPDFFHASSHWCWVHWAIDSCPTKDSISSTADCANGLRDLRRGLVFRRTKLLLKCSVSACFKVSRTKAGAMPARIVKYCVGVGF